MEKYLRIKSRIFEFSNLDCYKIIWGFNKYVIQKRE